MKISDAKVEAVMALHDSMERHRFLARCGLQECQDCKSWIVDTKTAVSFHYRRCSG